MEAILSFSIKPDLTGANSPWPVGVPDNGDGSYGFLYHPVEEGQVTLSVKVQGQKVFGSPFKWNVTSKLPDGLSSPQAKSAKRKKGKKGSLYDPVTQFPALKEGMHCWKLKLTCFSDESKCELEIGISSYTLCLGEKQTKGPGNLVHASNQRPVDQMVKFPPSLLLKIMMCSLYSLIWSQRNLQSTMFETNKLKSLQGLKGIISLLLLGVTCGSLGMETSGIQDLLFSRFSPISRGSCE